LLDAYADFAASDVALLLCKVSGSDIQRIFDQLVVAKTSKDFGRTLQRSPESGHKLRTLLAQLEVLDSLNSVRRMVGKEPLGPLTIS
jgi:hypothetical protein